MECNATIALDTQKPLTGFQLKIIALACMICDHIGAALLSPPEIWYDGTRAVGRIAFPIFAFLIAEGCRYTRSRERYLLRLGIFALISEIPFDLAFDTPPVQVSFLSFTNVFYTFFLAVACVHIYETLRRQRRSVQIMGVAAFGLAGAVIFGVGQFVTGSGKVACVELAAYLAGMLAACVWLSQRAERTEAAPQPDRLACALSLLPALPVLLLAELIGCDYGGAGVAIILGVYLVKKRPAALAVIAAGILYLYKNTIRYHMFHWDAVGFHLNLHTLIPVCFALLSLILLCFYSGKRGRSVKWAFYWACPAHIAVLALLRHFLIA